MHGTELGSGYHFVRSFIKCKLMEVGTSNSTLEFHCFLCKSTITWSDLTNLGLALPTFGIARLHLVLVIS